MKRSQLKRTPFKGRKRLLNTPFEKPASRQRGLNRGKGIRRRATAWDAVRKLLKPEFEKRGVTRCEFPRFLFHQCWLSDGLSFAHSRGAGEGKMQELDDAITDSKSILATHGYSGLESISSRVAKLETALHAAIEKRDGKEIARLGAELNRAQRGLSPIGKVAPAVKKTRKKKDPPSNGLDLSNVESGSAV